jgi:RNA polymerase sigma-70 factor (ECF subfamily)
MQDSWTALHHARSHYQVSASFKTYLYQIARNRLIDLMRQHQLVLASEVGDDETGESIFDDIAALGTPISSTHNQNENAIVSLTPEQQLIAKQRLNALHDAINELPSVQKEALVLQQFNDLSLDEIAQISAVPVETIKSRLRYAMQKLRLHFAKPEHRLEEFT